MIAANQPPSPTGLRGLYIRPATLSDAEAILILHSQAFADKFDGAFGANGAERGKAALAAAWQRQGGTAIRGMLVAILEEQIVGTASLRTREMPSDDNGAAEFAFHQVLGLWGALRSIMALSLLDHTIMQGEGFVTDVAVRPDFQRRGVARRLLAHIEQEARSCQKEFLGLYVSGANKGAQRLYYHHGFYKVRLRHSWMTRLFYGQRTWVYMKKDLT